MRLLRQAAAGPRPWAACSPPASTLTLLLLSLLAAAALARHHPPEGKIVYTIAGVDSDGAGSFRAHWKSTVNYLNREVGALFSPQLFFDTVIKGESEAAMAVATGDADFGILDAPVATCAVRQSDGEANTILTLQELIHGESLYETAGVIFSLSARSDIRSLADLSGKRIIAGTPKSLTAYQAQVAELKREGYDVMQSAGQIIFSSSVFGIIPAIQEGRADIGFLEAGVFEEKAALGLLRQRDFRILHRLESDYPFEISTHLYPGRPLVMHSQVPFLIQRLVSEALLRIDANSSVAMEDGYTGWRPSANYFELIDVLQASGVLAEGEHACKDVNNVADIITCPNQYVPRAMSELTTACTQSGFVCPESDNSTTYACLCHPCKRACGKNEEQQPDGACACVEGYIHVQGACVETTSLTLGIAIPLVLLLGILGWYLAKWQIRKADSLWHVRPHQLKFDDPAKVLGAGSFGVVIKAEYRGSAVALKSLRPPPRHVSATASVGSRGLLRSVTGKFRSGASAAGTTAGRNKHTARFGFVYSGFESVEDEERRGKLQLMRALRQGAEGLEDEKPANSASAFGAASNRKSARKSQKSYARSSARSGTNFWKTRAKRERDEFVQEMRLLSKLRHPCVTTVIGAVLEPGCVPVLVMEYMDLGSLYSILHNETMSVQPENLHMMMLDIVSGCRFLHAAEPPVVHGDLKAMNVLVDSRFRAKVADFGLSGKLKTCAGTPYWMAPELLKGCKNSKASDVYAFGMVLFEMVTRQDPYEGEESEDVLREVIKSKKRPVLPRGVEPELAVIMKECWHWDAERRPTFLELERRMSHFDSIHLAERNMKQNKNTTGVLDQVFPAHVAKALAAGEKLQPERYDAVTIFFSDIVGFTDISRTLPPEKVCDMLDRLYTSFDILTEKHDIFKVETIGDAYMAVTNLHKPQAKHAEKIAHFALDALKAAQATMVDEEDPQRGCIRLRIGFHTGPVVANVVGTKNPRYCLFGDTVNTASRMESSSEAERIHLSDAAFAELQAEKTKLVLEARGKIDVKGKGLMETYWLKGRGAQGQDASLISEDELSAEVSRRRSGASYRSRIDSLASLPKSLAELEEQARVPVPPSNLSSAQTAAGTVKVKRSVGIKNAAVEFVPYLNYDSSTRSSAALV